MININKNSIKILFICVFFIYNTSYVSADVSYEYTAHYHNGGSAVFKVTLPKISFYNWESFDLKVTLVSWNVPGYSQNSSLAFLQNYNGYYARKDWSIVGGNSASKEVAVSMNNKNYGNFAISFYDPSDPQQAAGVPWNNTPLGLIKLSIFKQPPPPPPTKIDLHFNP